MKTTVALFSFLVAWFYTNKTVLAGCLEMKHRLKESHYLKSFLTIIPNDDTFTNGSTINITCLGIKPDVTPTWVLVKERFYPYKLQIFEGLKNLLKTCLVATKLEERAPEKECSTNYNMKNTGNFSITCAARNDYGNECTITSVTITATVPRQPKLALQPPRLINISEGLDLNLTCKSLEVPRPFITWYKNGQHVTRHKVTLLKGTSTLMLSSIELNDSGKYWCRVNNSLGHVVSKGSDVTVFAPPKFTTDPKDHKVFIGTKVTLACQVSGYPLPRIGWTRDGEDLGTGIQIDHEILQRNTTESDVDDNNTTRKLNVTMSTSFLMVMSSLSFVTMSSFSQPTSISQSLLPSSTPSLPSSLTLSSFPSSTQSSSSLSSSSLSFEIKASRNITPSLTTASQHERKSKSKDNRPFMGTIKQIDGNSTLIIPSALTTTQGKYQCYASNAVGDAKSTEAVLTVGEKPRFNDVPRNTSVILGTSVTMNCSATGFPAPNITWNQNKSTSLVINNNRVSVKMKNMTSFLNIFNVSHDDQGVYECRAKNTFGSITSPAAYLLIKESSLPKTLTGTDMNLVWSAVGASLSILFVVMVILLACIIKKVRAGHKHRKSSTMMKPTADMIVGENNVALEEDLVDDQVYLQMMGIDRDWELPRSRLKRTNDKLGSGCFGNVYSGVYTRHDGKEMLVAVKMLKVNATEADRNDLIAELEILKHVGRHPNIVSLVGACTQDEPIYIVIELVEGGNLQQLLLNTRLPYENRTGYENIKSTLNDHDFINIALNVSKGMCHLHSKKCIHRDLAARNVLISKGLVAKIADFGLARSVPSDGLYVKTSEGKVPWKWMAPEALRGLFTKQTDIWSFGILLWEIASLGDVPYPDINQVFSLYNLLVDGFRLAKPSNCDDLLYELMIACWSAESTSRPPFEQITSILQDILNQNKAIYIDIVAGEDEMLEHAF